MHTHVHTHTHTHTHTLTHLNSCSPLCPLLPFLFSLVMARGLDYIAQNAKLLQSVMTQRLLILISLHFI